MLVILPIYLYQVEFPFYQINILFVTGFITFSRWLFLWRFTPYAWYKPLKLAMIFLMIPVIFIGINKFYDFKIYLDEIGIQELVTGYDEHVQHNLSVYIRSEMIFFGTTFIMTAIFIPFKMIWSIWKQYNRNEV
jgi:hypothetical protein